MCNFMHLIENHQIAHNIAEVKDMAGRKSKYDSFVKPRLNDIKEMVSKGATDKEIADSIGISLSTLYEYKKTYSELMDTFVRGRQSVIVDIKSALLKKAMGFNYEEKKQFIKTDVETGKQTQYTEITTRYCPPSETACAMLLRNYDSEWVDQAKINVNLKQQELELRKQIADSKEWN